MIVIFEQKWDCIRHQWSHGVHSKVFDSWVRDDLVKYSSGSYRRGRQCLLESSQECLGNWFWRWNYLCLGQ